MHALGLIGAGKIARVHAANAAALEGVRLAAVADVVPEAARALAEETGAEALDAESLLARDDVEAVLVTTPPDTHVDVIVAAAKAGKHVFCEKPLGRTAGESHEMWRRVGATGVKHMTAFNYRFVPAVRLAREMLEAGELGDVLHFRGRYLQEWGTTTADAWRFHKDDAGSGALGDLGAHVIDLARYLVGEISSVSASMRTFMDGREVDDAFEAVVDFESRALGTIEATRFAAGRKNAFSWEINGTKGSLAFDLERLNELHHSDGTKGFRTILVSEADHPFWEWWWPHGHMIGWEHSFVHEIHHLLTAIAGDGDVAPHGATFEDGYRAAEVCDAIVRSSESGRREDVLFRGA